MNMVLAITAIVLLIIIGYFLLRLRSMMRNAKGASSDMNTFQLIKNWQEQKAVEAQYQGELREKAREAARPEIEKTMIERYKKEEIAKATTPKGEQLRSKLKSGLGIDSDRVFGQENMDRMIGRPGSNKEDVFNKDKIARMIKGGNINSDRIKQASGKLNWDEGMRKGLQNESKFEGIERALGRDRKIKRDKDNEE